MLSPTHQPTQQVYDNLGQYHDSTSYLEANAYLSESHRNKSGVVVLVSLVENEHHFISMFDS
jgi:hypothetical protein